MEVLSGSKKIEFRVIIDTDTYMECGCVVGIRCMKKYIF